MTIQPIDEAVALTCPYCAHPQAVTLAHFATVPVYLGCTDQPANQDDFIDYNLTECANCKLITTHAPLTNSTYDHLHSEAVGKTWQKHHQHLTSFVQKQKSSISNMLEIGPSSKPIARMLSNKLKHIIYIDLLKELPFTLKTNETFLSEAFPSPLTTESFDLIVASHVFEHAANPDQFFSSAINQLHDDGLFIISIPNFEHWLSYAYWNGITPEHTHYPFAYHLDLLAKKYQINMTVHSYEYHSIFFSFSKGKPYQTQEHITPTPLAQDWIKQINSSLKLVETELANLDANNVFLTGASHLSQYSWLMSSLLQTKVRFTLDNSPTKTGKRLYGTSLTTQSFDYLKKVTNPVVIVFNSPYSLEMSNQVITLNSRAHLIHG